VRVLQNWAISQAEPGKIESVNLCLAAVGLAKEKKCPSIAYNTANQPAFYGIMYDTAFLAKQNGVRTSGLTCGYINPEPLKELCKVIDAANVDLKVLGQFTGRWQRPNLRRCLRS